MSAVLTSRWRGWGEKTTGLHGHHQNDLYLMKGSDVSHFSVPATAESTDTKQCPETTSFQEDPFLKPNEINRPCKAASYINRYYMTHCLPMYAQKNGCALKSFTWLRMSLENTPEEWLQLQHTTATYFLPKTLLMKTTAA